MHELSVAAGILEIVHRYVPVSRAPDVRSVRVRVGDTAGVLPDSLVFCFDALVAGTPYATASLDLTLTSGDDLKVVDVELDDGVEVAP